MADISSFEVFSIARNARGMSQTELAEKIGITQSMISKIENGTAKPANDTLEKIAEVLEYPASLFIGEHTVRGLPSSVHPMWRRAKNLDSKITERLLGLVNVSLWRLEILLDNQPPSLNLPQHSYDDPIGAAQQIRKHSSIPTGAIENLTEVCEAFGIVVVHTDLSNAGADGLSLRTKQLPAVVFLNKRMPADRMRFTLAHELGHLVMHQTPNAQMEEQANEFAAELLMPESDIKSELAVSQLLDLYRLKPIWRVSIASLLYRAQKLEAIEKSKASYFWRRLQQLGIRSKEPPELDFDVEPTNLFDGYVEDSYNKFGRDIDRFSQHFLSLPEKIGEFSDLPLKLARGSMAS
jgi:Zn-dependent peptidase ImmA (M78 family)/transcriptional regulator with XRE-family HTH domain